MLVVVLRAAVVERSDASRRRRGDRGLGVSRENAVELTYRKRVHISGARARWR